LKDGRFLLAAGHDARVHVGTSKGAAADAAWIAYTDVITAEATPVEFIASAGGRLEVWLNGTALHKRAMPAPYRPGSDRFKGELVKGPNRVLVLISTPGPSVDFHLDFRRLSASAVHERLIQAALARTGDAKRGAKVFFNADKASCVKCHRLGEVGERIGPELTGIGARFGRVYLIESILEPNRTVVPGFSSLFVSLKDGRLLTGVKVAETETALTLADNEGKKHDIKRTDIDEQRPVPTSTMPEGLEKKLTEQEFVDLIAFLVSQKDRTPPKLTAK
jgi:putative heme-binding domain-containing protein